MFKETLSIHERYLVEDLRLPIADLEQAQPHQVALAPKAKDMNGVNTDVVNYGGNTHNLHPHPLPPLGVSVY